VIDDDPDDRAAFVGAWRVVVATRDALAAGRGADYAGEWARQLGDELADVEAIMRARGAMRDRGGGGDPSET